MIRFLWKCSGRLDGGASYFWYCLGIDRNGDAALVDHRIISVEDFWAGRAA